MNQDKPKIIVYYDGACPKCVKDRRTYEKLAGKAGAYVCWTDITGQETLLREMGIDPHKALTELHVQDEERQILSEMDAYILLMGKVPLLKPYILYRFSSLNSNFIFSKNLRRQLF